MKISAEKRGLIRLFAEHPVAANLLMVLIFLGGFWGLIKLNTQFLPNFEVNFITVSVTWPGASSADVERSITLPIEEKLRDVDHIKKINSVSSEGLSLITMEFKQDTDMSNAVQQVRDRISQIRTLPEDSRKPNVTRVERYDAIARVVITSNDQAKALRYWAYKMEQQLLNLGIAKIQFTGMPKKEISIGITPQQLSQLRLSLGELSTRINAQSQDISAGTVGRDTGGRILRILSQRRNAKSFEQLPIVSGDVQQLVRLIDIASIQEKARDYAKIAYYKNKPAISMTLFRTPTTDALKSAEILHKWQKEMQKTLPKGMEVHVYQQIWMLIKERINVLLQNGLGGLLLIFVLLFLFLNHRVATWVALGIPISISAALYFLQLIGGSINMITMFALIMALGIIVDDTIVVGEEGATQFQNGLKPIDAAIIGARRMLVPVLAASLTTIAAFAPLLLLSGVFGKVLIAIPKVIICVIIASLLEAFLILPNHIKKSFVHIQKEKRFPYRKKLDSYFLILRDRYFRKFVSSAIEHPWVTLAIAASAMIITMGLLLSGRPNFTFFPTPDGKVLFTDVTFVSGTSKQHMQEFLQQLETAAWKTNKALSPKNKPILKTVVRFQHSATDRYETRSHQRIGSLITELISPAERDITNVQFIQAWRKNIVMKPWVEDLRIQSRRPGPGGADIDVVLTGAKAPILKKAALELTQKLKGYRGIYNVVDNLPYALDEWIFSLKPEAYALGLSTADIGKQLRAAYTGQLMQIFHKGKDEIEVRVRLQDTARHQLSSLETLPITTKNGKIAPLRSLVNITSQKSFDALQHTDYELAVHVRADVNADIGNSSKIIADMEKNILPSIINKYSLQYSLKGRAQDQEETLTEMKYAIILTLGLIYIILAWVSASYIWPLFVMVAIPLGLVGAIFGHLIMGINLTLLSLFGFFGLTGIVINDSIILLLRYKELLENGLCGNEAIIEACCQRFRAVILTSLTTIAGLSPLLFEKSRQAQFLIPMATAICFGLAVATLLILVVIPTLLSITKTDNSVYCN